MQHNTTQRKSTPRLLINSLIMMRKFNFIRDGATSELPPGFRFQPTDQEIVFQYLARKIFSCPLPASVIPEFDVFALHPSHLPGDSERDRYFFASREVNLRNVGGFWKATGPERRIVLSSPTRRSFPIVGVKRTLVFYQGKHPRAVRTGWFVHVYYISTSADAERRRRQQGGGTVQIGKWVLCHVFSKRKGTLKDEEVMSSDESSSCSSSSSSSDSSVLSEVSSTS